jgi:hypothetical protein
MSPLLIHSSVKGSGLVDNNNKGAGTAPRNRTGRECLIVCLWGYATYLNVHSTLAHLDRGGIHPTTLDWPPNTYNGCVVVDLSRSELQNTSFCAKD